MEESQEAINQLSAPLPRGNSVSFPIFAKIDGNGPHAHPLCQFLKRGKPGIFGFFGMGSIKWNFTKFLIDRKGRVVRCFGSATEPTTLAAAIEKLLNGQ
jgi:glutathione peroxidase